MRFLRCMPNKITSYAVKMTEQDVVKSTDDEEQVFKTLTFLFFRKSNILWVVRVS